jgi:hypothetical protein
MIVTTSDTMAALGPMVAMLPEVAGSGSVSAHECMQTQAHSADVTRDGAPLHQRRPQRAPRCCERVHAPPGQVVLTTLPMTPLLRQNPHSFFFSARLSHSCRQHALGRTHQASHAPLAATGRPIALSRRVPLLAKLTRGHAQPRTPQPSSQAQPTREQAS